ncbi:hypothetical protein V5799_007123 [Amblyomma americanum]|uniref:BEN domain-containing protein n=1 Tax=Amblyomma americanum TaxID=6943 RepID=A0AAQ4DUF7_AMBAM
MFAYVRFRDDDMKTVLPISRFRSFQPKGLKDFATNKWYEVFWEDNEQSGYYQAQIVRLFDTKEEAERQKRIPVPPRPSDTETEETTPSSDDSLREVMRKAAAEKKKKKNNSQRILREKQLQQLMENEPDEQAHELEQLRRENKDLRERLKTMEKALCSKIFDAEQLMSRHCSCKQKRPEIRTSERVPAKGAVERMPALSAPAGPEKVPPAAPEAKPADPPARESQRPVAVLAPPQPSLGHNPATPEECAADQLEGLPFQATGSKVFLGHGVSLTREGFNHLMSRQKDSVFVREACVQIFSTAGLVGKSITGNMCNRTKADPKPPLDQQKYAALSAFFQHYLEARYEADEARRRHRSLNKIVAGKLADVFLEDGTEVDEESFKYMQENFGGNLGCTFILGSSAFTSDPFNAG